MNGLLFCCCLSNCCGNNTHACFSLPPESTINICKCQLYAPYGCNVDDNIAEFGTCNNNGSMKCFVPKLPTHSIYCTILSSDKTVLSLSNNDDDKSSPYCLW